MTDKRCKILEQKALAESIYQVVLEAPEIAAEARPGQFVNLYCDNAARLLPRPISICDADAEKGTLTLIYAVVGEGTEEFAAKKDGECIRVMGPLGNGFPLEAAEQADEIILVGGGLGIPPLLFLSRCLNAPEKVKVILGFRSEAWMGTEFEPYGTVYPVSDDGATGFKGNAVQRLRFYLKMQNHSMMRTLYSCGPLPMMHALQKAYENDETMDLWFSLEERMGCGFGACAGCPAKLRMPDGSIKQQGVCKMGPVFPGKAVIFGE